MQEEKIRALIEGLNGRTPRQALTFLVWGRSRSRSGVDLAWIWVRSGFDPGYILGRSRFNLGSILIEYNIKLHRQAELNVNFWRGDLPHKKEGRPKIQCRAFMICSVRRLLPQSSLHDKQRSAMDSCPTSFVTLELCTSLQCCTTCFIGSKCVDRRTDIK